MPGLELAGPFLTAQALAQCPSTLSPPSHPREGDCHLVLQKRKLCPKENEVFDETHTAKEGATELGIQVLSLQLSALRVE